MLEFCRRTKTGSTILRRRPGWRRGRSGSRAERQGTTDQLCGSALLGGGTIQSWGEAGSLLIRFRRPRSKTGFQRDHRGIVLGLALSISIVWLDRHSAMPGFTHIAPPVVLAFSAVMGALFYKRRMNIGRRLATIAFVSVVLNPCRSEALPSGPRCWRPRRYRADAYACPGYGSLCWNEDDL